MKKQTLFDLLDGMLMVSFARTCSSQRLTMIVEALAVWIFNIVHPGWFLPRHERVVGNAV